MKYDELKATSSGEIRARDALLGHWWYEKFEADKVIAEKDKEIIELKGAQYWRKCSEELPKDGQLVWAYGPNGKGVLNLRYTKSDSGEGFICFPYINDFYHGITHWMPFEVPKPPEETPLIATSK